MLSVADIVSAVFWAAVSAATAYFGLDVFVCFFLFKTFDVFGSLAASFWPVFILFFIVILFKMLSRRSRERHLIDFLHKRYHKEDEESNEL